MCCSIVFAFYVYLCCFMVMLHVRLHICLLYCMCIVCVVLLRFVFSMLFLFYFIVSLCCVSFLQLAIYNIYIYIYWLLSDRSFHA